MSLPALHPPGNGSGTASPTPAGHPLDKLTDATTAFATWGELLERLHRGYVPTLRPEHGRRVRLLRKAVVAAGFPVWPADPKPRPVSATATV